MSKFHPYSMYHQSSMSHHQISTHQHLINSRRSFTSPPPPVSRSPPLVFSSLSVGSMMTGPNSRMAHGFGAPYTPAAGYRVDHRHSQGNMFGTVDDSMLARMEASLAAVADMKSHQMHAGHHSQTFKPVDMYSHHDMGGYMTASAPKPQFSFPGDGMLENMNTAQTSGLMPAPPSQFPTSLTQLTNMNPHTSSMAPIIEQHHPAYPMYSHSTAVSMLPQMSMSHPAVMQNLQEVECDPRELESFAERFKQRRIKLGVTQADVGKALANLKLPGVGSLSQSTICRFESLTLSHNNMIALKPVLSAWLDEAERIAREKQNSAMMDGMALDKKRKRTSIAAPEKRSLEAYFAIQPRPSGEKIAQIADKLDLKKNVVRVWFCNQRQKQKRMKFSTPGQSH